MKLRAYLVDDEPLAVERLRRLLEQTGRVEVTGSSTEPEQAVAALTGDPPGRVLPRHPNAAAEWLRCLGELPRQPIEIFTTAYDQYAIRAFAVNSIDYLLTPIEPEAVNRAIGDAAFGPRRCQLRGRDETCWRCRK